MVNIILPLVDILPLVEFIPEGELTHEEVKEAIKCDPSLCCDSLSHPCKTTGIERPQAPVNSFTIERDVFADKLVTLNVSVNPLSMTPILTGWL